MRRPKGSWRAGRWWARPRGAEQDRQAIQGGPGRYVPRHVSSGASSAPVRCRGKASRAAETGAKLGLPSWHSPLATPPPTPRGGGVEPMLLGKYL